jgi:hypothetical protein
MRQQGEPWGIKRIYRLYREKASQCPNGALDAAP